MDDTKGMPSGVLHKIQHFFKDCRIKHYDKRQLLITGGEEPGYIYFLIKGQVRVFDITRQGNEVVIGVFKAPTLFPVAWALLKRPNPYFYDAATEVIVKAAPPDEVLEFVKKNPDVMFDMLLEIYAGAETLRRQVAHLAGGTAKSRVLLGLSVEAKRFGRHLGKDSWLLAITETELGRRTGVSRETVSREINKLKHMGLISLSRKGIKINSLAILQKELGTLL